MRKIVLVLNLAIIAFFLCFLAYTFIARMHLNGLARNFVTEKTVEYSKPAVNAAEKTLASPVVQKLLLDEQEEVIRQEIAGYHEDPNAYVSDLTGQKIRKVSPVVTNPLLKKVLGLKAKIRVFYDDTLNALIKDVRIFAVCNIIAAMVAFVLACRSPQQISKALLVFSILITASVFCCSYLYVDDLTFFRILFRTHMGWMYAGYIVSVAVMIFNDYGDQVMDLADEDVAKTKPDQSGQLRRN